MPRSLAENSKNYLTLKEATGAEIVVSFHFLVVGPKISLSSNRVIAEEKENVTIACNATGMPQPEVTWFRSVGTLPKDRTAETKGVLHMYK